MKRLTISIIIFILTIALFLFAQDDATTADQQAIEGEVATENATSTQSSITNFLIDDFENASTWQASMPNDAGIISILRLEGGPADVIAENAESNKYILGAKVEYFRTGSPWFSIVPPRPIKIPGITKEISLWVAGRNSNNKLSIFVRDVYGRMHKLGNHKLNYVGWKKVTINIPDNIPQEIYRERNNDGLDFMGIQIKVDPRDSFGTYYVYFDNLVAETDMYMENYRLEDDPIDNW